MTNLIRATRLAKNKAQGVVSNLAYLLEDKPSGFIRAYWNAHNIQQEIADAVTALNALAVEVNKPVRVCNECDFETTEGDVVFCRDRRCGGLVG